jgi:hypothetical protein
MSATTSTTESPPGPEKGNPASGETHGVNDLTKTTTNLSSTFNQNPQLCDDGLPKIISAEEFRAANFKDDICDECGGVMSECHCYDDDEDELLTDGERAGYQEWVDQIRKNALEGWDESIQKIAREISSDPVARHTLQIFQRLDEPKRSQLKDWLVAGGLDAKDLVSTSESDTTDNDQHEYKRIDAIDFPKAIHNDAFHGIAGEVVSMLCTGSELKPEAVLSQFLCIFGNMLGRAPYKIQDGRHGTLINVAIVGNTADGAKGNSYQAVKRLIRAVSPDYCTDNIKGGYNSSEALIGDITDEIEGIKKGQTVVIEEGVDDKRLLVVEEEFSRILQIGKRDGVTMSEVLRQCFDVPDALRAPSRKSYLVSTNPFVSIVGHITPEGLKKCMDSAEAFNGFANRFMFIASHRTASIPEPPVIDWSEGRGAEIVNKLQAILKIYCPHPLVSSTNPDLEFKFSQKAKEKWAQIYHEISGQSRNTHGYQGAIIARAKPTILRLSLIYSALDSPSLIEPKHLDAASALWDYATASAMWSFEGMSGSKEANEILKYLKRYPNGVSRTVILGDVFRNNLAASKLTEALSELKSSGFAEMKKNGKCETWFPVRN